MNPGAPIGQISTTIQDPTWSGNRMVGFDENNVEGGSVNFAFNSTPGTNNPDMKQLNGTFWRVDLIPAANDFVAYDVVVILADQQVRITCTPLPTRGSNVSCAIRLVFPEAFTVLQRTATGSDFTVQDTPNINVSAGGVDNWQGEAVASAKVNATVRTAAGATYASQQPGQFTVQPRSWPQWQLNLMFYHDTLHQQMLPVPTPRTSTSAGSTVGGFAAKLPNPAGADSLKADTADTGPNRGIWYWTSALTVNAYDVYIHPALIPHNLKPTDQGYMPWHRWFDDQNGGLNGTCRRNDVARLRSNVERHEGVTAAIPNSHYAVANVQFAALRPERNLEKMYTDRSKNELLLILQDSVQAFDKPSGTYRQAQNQFDSPNEYTAVWGVGCNFDFNPLNSRIRSHIP